VPAPPKAPPRKLPPVPTFAAPKPGGGIGAPANGVMAAGKEKSSDAISLLLDEYDEADD
jgi:hypothetical protein